MSVQSDAELLQLMPHAQRKLDMVRQKKAILFAATAHLLPVEPRHFSRCADPTPPF
jgi:hypothetical protein